MTKKQTKFVDEYLKDFNATQAAIRSGFSFKTAGVQGHELLKKPQIQARLEEKKLELQKNSEDNWLTPENIAKGFKNIHDRCMQAAPVMRYNSATRRMEQVTDENGNHVWQFDSNGANRAWENIAKHIGFYELDNTQKTPVINVNLLQQQNNFYGNGEQAAGNNGELTDPSLFTLLPPPTD
jgi:phage terminase small subunit